MTDPAAELVDALARIRRTLSLSAEELEALAVQVKDLTENEPREAA